MGKQWTQWLTFIFLGSKITADGDCSHEIKRCLLLGMKVMTNLDSVLKSRDTTLPTKVPLVKVMVFQWSCMDVRVGLWRKLSTKELMLLNCGAGEDSWESLGLAIKWESLLNKLLPQMKIKSKHRVNLAKSALWLNKPSLIHALSSPENKKNWHQSMDKSVFMALWYSATYTKGPRRSLAHLCIGY